MEALEAFSKAAEVKPGCRAYEVKRSGACILKSALKLFFTISRDVTSDLCYTVYVLSSIAYILRCTLPCKSIQPLELFHIFFTF